jgi:hypothetical protein
MAAPSPLLWTSKRNLNDQIQHSKPDILERRRPFGSQAKIYSRHPHGEVNRFTDSCTNSLTIYLLHHECQLTQDVVHDFVEKSAQCGRAHV